MILKTHLDIDRDKLIDEIYIATQLEHKRIDEVLLVIEKYLYGQDILEYD